MGQKLEELQQPLIIAPEIIVKQEILSPFDERRLEEGVQVFSSDVDRTFSTKETGNEMLAENGVQGDDCTNAETNGHMPFPVSFRTRYDAGKPNRALVERFGDTFHQHLTPNALETVRAFRYLGKRTDLVSGGIQQIFERAANRIGIPVDHIHAIPLLFDKEGNYAGFDRNHVLLRDDGKALVIEQIVGGNGTFWCHGGDGNTDQLAVLKARTQQAGLFIAFAGFAWRDWMVDAPITIDRADFSPFLPLITGTNTDWHRLLDSVHRKLFLTGLGHILAGHVSFRNDYLPYLEAVKRFVKDRGLRSEIERIKNGYEAVILNRVHLTEEAGFY